MIGLEYYDLHHERALFSREVLSEKEMNEAP